MKTYFENDEFIIPFVSVKLINKKSQQYNPPTKDYKPAIFIQQYDDNYQDGIRLFYGEGAEEFLEDYKKWLSIRIVPSTMRSMLDDTPRFTI